MKLNRNSEVKLGNSLYEQFDLLMRNSTVVLSNVKVQLETSISFLHDAKIFFNGANSKEIERNKILYCARCETMQLKYSKPGKSVLLVY